MSSVLEGLMVKHVSMLLLFGFIASPALSQVYKCTEGGKVVFSDYPCQRTDAKMIDVRPAAGGPVNRSSEYWDELKQREEKAAAEEKAQFEREAKERWKRKDEIFKEREATFAAFTPREKFNCAYSATEKVEAQKMDQIFGGYLAATNVALTTPRIGLAAPRIKLAELEYSILKFRFQTECLINLQQNARGYMTNISSVLSSFASGYEKNEQDAADASRFLNNYIKGWTMYRIGN